MTGDRDKCHADGADSFDSYGSVQSGRSSDNSDRNGFAHPHSTLRWRERDTLVDAKRPLCYVVAKLREVAFDLSHDLLGT